MRFLDNGKIEIDNNAAERSIIGLWTKLFPRALNFIQKNNFSKLNYLILGRI